MHDRIQRFKRKPQGWKSGFLSGVKIGLMSWRLQLSKAWWSLVRNDSLHFRAAHTPALESRAEPNEVRPSYKKVHKRLVSARDSPVLLRRVEWDGALPFTPRLVLTHTLCLSLYTFLTLSLRLRGISSDYEYFAICDNMIDAPLSWGEF